MRRTPNICLLALVLAPALAACATPDPPPAAYGEIPRRAPTTPAASLLVGLPGVSAVPRAMRADLTRGNPAVCVPRVGAVLDPVGEGRFRLLLSEPGLAVTRESVLRRTVAGPPDAPELALDGANNGRCDYLLRVAGP